MRKPVPLGVALLLVVLLTPAVFAKEASVSLREGLYAEEVEGNLDAAIKIYQQVIDDKTAQKNIVAQALYRQGMCYMKQKNETEAKAAFSKLVANYGDQTELVAKVKPLLDELGNADPAALMPPETIAYIEIGSPGKQVETILNMLKGTPFENPLEVIGGNQGQAQPSSGPGGPADIIKGLLNPSMMAEFQKIRGMGLGVTGIAHNNPPFVLVLFPGKSDALRGILQMVLGFAGQPADDIDGVRCISIAGSAAAAYDDNVVILAQSSNSLEQLRWSVRQYKGLANDPTLASSNKSFATVSKKARQENVLTVWVDADKVYSSLVKMFPQGEIPMEIQMANGLIDFASINDLIASLSLKTTGIAIETNVNLNEGHHCLAYSLARTPPLNRTALKAVPADAIGLVSIGMGQSGTPQAEAVGGQIKNALGLDIGRELFDNIEQVTFFALPYREPAEQLSNDIPPQAKSIGLVITSANPEQTHQILSKVLRTANLIVGEKQPAAGRYEFTLPNRQNVFGCMDQGAKTTVLSLSSDVVERSMAAIKQSAATTKTGPLSDALNALPETTSKLVVVNVAGVIEFGAQNMEMPDDEMAEQVRGALAQLAKASQKTTIELRTSEETNSFGLRLSVNNLPPIGEVIGPITQISQVMSQMQHQAGSWATSATPPATVLGTDTAPTIDGKIDDCWAKAKVHELKNSFYDSPSSPEDCSATFKALYDKNSLYVLVDVADEDMQNDSEEFWLDDGVEVFIDADNSRSGSYGSNDYQYFFGWDAASPVMGKGGEQQNDGTKFAFAKTAKGYRLEVQFAWSTLGATVRPGASIGFDVQVNDDDGGGERDSKIAWNATEDDAWQNTKAFGTAQLAGLIAWWKLDESEGRTAADSSGNGNNATVQGDPDWRPAGGKIAGAIDLGGDGDFLDVANESAFDFAGEVTVAAWINAEALDKPWQAIVTKGDSAWRIQRNNETDTLEFACSGLDLPNGNQYGSLLGSRSISLNEWYHVAGTYDGSKMCLYVDGVLDASQEASGGINVNDALVQIGSNAEMGDRFWSGLLDDIRVYNYALSDADIAALAGR